MNKKGRNLNSPLLQVLIIAAHVVAALLTILIVAILLIAVNHTALLLIATAWSPIFLFLVPSLTLALSLGIVFLNQPVHSLLCLISVFFSVFTLLLYVGAEFLAFLLLIVYVGAVAILFLFVIMLLHAAAGVALSVLLIAGTAELLLTSAGVTAVGLEDALASGINNFFITSDAIAFKTSVTSAEAVVNFVNNKFVDILAFSNLLYTYHVFLFFIAGILLLTAMLGAIILATSATDAPDRFSASIVESNALKYS